MSFAKRFLLMTAIVIALTDLIILYLRQQMPFVFVAEIIVVTLAPIIVILTYWTYKYKLEW